MRLSESVETILGRSLTVDEVSNLNNFQRLHGVDDDDPLIVVLAMVGANRVLMESFPKVLEEAANRTIELHRQTLMEQSTIIAKDLITNIAFDLMRRQWIPYLASFVGGLVCAAIVFKIFSH